MKKEQYTITILQPHNRNVFYNDGSSDFYFAEGAQFEGELLFKNPDLICFHCGDVTMQFGPNQIIYVKKE